MIPNLGVFFIKISFCTHNETVEKVPCKHYIPIFASKLSKNSFSNPI